MPSQRKARKGDFTPGEGKNNKLLFAIRDAGYISLREFADLVGINYQTVIRLISKNHTYSDAWMANIHLIMVDLGKFFHELFDVEEYERQQLEMSEETQRAELFFANQSLIDPLETVAESQLRSDMDRAISDLTYKERFVLVERFGLSSNEKILAEVGECLDVSVERVRQVEMKALRKLRHPSRSLGLFSFLDNGKTDYLTEENLKSYVSPTRANVYVPPIRFLPKPTAEDIATKPPVEEPKPPVVEKPVVKKELVNYEGKGWGFTSTASLYVKLHPPVKTVVKTDDVQRDEWKAVGWLKGLFDYARHPESLHELNNYTRVSITLLEQYLGLSSAPRSLTEISSWTRMFLGQTQGLTVLEVREHIASAALLVDQHIRGRLTEGVQREIRKLLRSKLVHDYREDAVEMMVQATV